MAREIKVYGTNYYLSGKALIRAQELGLPEHSRQVRLICGATSFAEANRMCEAKGMHNVFRKGYTSITGNPRELALASNGGIFVKINAPYEYVGEYYSIDELRGEPS